MILKNFFNKFGPVTAVTNIFPVSSGEASKMLRFIISFEVSFLKKDCPIPFSLITKMSFVGWGSCLGTGGHQSEIALLSSHGQGSVDQYDKKVALK